MFGRLGRVPHIGDRVGFNGGELEVVAVDGRRVAALRVLRPRSATSEHAAVLPSVPPAGPASKGPPAPSASSKKPVSV